MSASQQALEQELSELNDKISYWNELLENPNISKSIKKICRENKQNALLVVEVIESAIKNQNNTT